MQELLTAISTVGFPIVACIAMFWMNEKQDRRHQDEVNKLNETVANNTVALTKLATLIEVHKEESN